MHIKTKVNKKVSLMINNKMQMKLYWLIATEEIGADKIFSKKVSKMYLKNLRITNLFDLWIEI